MYCCCRENRVEDCDGGEQVGSERWRFIVAAIQNGSTATVRQPHPRHGASTAHLALSQP